MSKPNVFVCLMKTFLATPSVYLYLHLYLHLYVYLYLYLYLYFGLAGSIACPPSVHGRTPGMLFRHETTPTTETASSFMFGIVIEEE